MVVQLMAALRWLASFFQDASGSTSSKRLIFICTGFTFLGMCIGMTTAVVADVRETASILQLLIVTVATMATGGYLGGKAIEKKAETTQGDAP